MFWFLMIALVVVVAAVTLGVIGGGSEAVLPEAEPDRVADGLPRTRPVVREDVDALRLPVAPRGYRMAEVDDVLERLAAELAERDERIAELTGRPGPAGPTARTHPAPSPAATATATATVTATEAATPDDAEADTGTGTGTEADSETETRADEARSEAETGTPEPGTGEPGTGKADDDDADRTGRGERGGR